MSTADSTAHHGDGVGAEAFAEQALKHLCIALLVGVAEGRTGGDRIAEAEDRYGLLSGKFGADRINFLECRDRCGLWNNGLKLEVVDAETELGQGFVVVRNCPLATDFQEL